MEPVDPAADYLTTRGTLRPGVTLAVYDPALDTGDPPPAASAWAKPVPMRGSRGEARTTVEGEVSTTRVTWLITNPPGVEFTGRPTLQSRISQGGDVWVVTAITPNPINGRIWRCDCVKAFN